MTNTTHPLELLVEETQLELASVEAELVALQAQAAALQAKAVVLREEHASFLAALNRRVPTAKTEKAAEAAEASDQPIWSEVPLNEWRVMARTNAVEKALVAVAAGGPASPADVQAYMSEMGRNDGRDLVSAALAHLKRSGRAWRVGYSQWSPYPPRTQNAESPAGTGLSGDVATGEGGDSIAQISDHGDAREASDRDHRSGASIETH